MPEPLYRLRNVGHSYEGRRVLTVDELDIVPGEIIALVGPSGGQEHPVAPAQLLESPTEGRIEYRGRPFDARNPMPLALRREVTTVFQRPLLLSRSVRDNVLIRCIFAAGMGRRWLRRSNAWARRWPARRPAPFWQRGQRVALARALVVGPPCCCWTSQRPIWTRITWALSEIVQQLNAERGRRWCWSRTTCSRRASWPAGWCFAQWERRRSGG